MNVVLFTENDSLKKKIKTLYPTIRVIKKELSLDLKSSLLNTNFFIIDSDIKFINWKILVNQIKYTYKLSYIPIIILIDNLDKQLKMSFKYIGFVDFILKEEIEKNNFQALYKSFNKIISFYNSLKINNRLISYFSIFLSVKDKSISSKVNYFLDFVSGYYEINETNTFFIRFILNELIDNSIRYSGQKIKVVLFKIKNKISLKIEDFGKGFMYEKHINKNFNEIYEEINPDKLGGLGLFMIKKLVNKIIFNNIGNTIILEKVV